MGVGKASRRESPGTEGVDWLADQVGTGGLTLEVV